MTSGPPPNNPLQTDKGSLMKGLESAAVLQAKVQIEGTCSDRFAPVRDAFAHNLETGQDIGASVAVFVDGESVVGLWGGYVDGTYTRAFGRHTAACVAGMAR